MGLDPSSKKPRKVIVGGNEAFENDDKGSEMHGDDGIEI